MNRLPARVVEVSSEAGLVLVEAEVGPHRFAAMLVGPREQDADGLRGQAVQLVFKETEVALAKNLSGLISLRNRHPARITHLERGRLLTQASLDFDGHALAAVITSASATRLALAVGDAVEWLVKANEMAIEPA